MRFWPFRSNKPVQPKFIDATFVDLARMFLAYPPDPTPGSDLLDAAQLDYSVQSLAAVDAHLDVMRSRDLNGEACVKFVLRCGAYVGEVIRRSAAPPTAWHWVDYRDACKLRKDLSALGNSLGTTAMLWIDDQTICFPLGKVCKFLENGSGDSVLYFARVALSNLVSTRPRDAKP